MATMNRMNRWLALRLTASVGTMWCFYLFVALSLISLPAVIASGNLIAEVSWLTQTCIQLVLLPAIIVGQNLQGETSEQRARETHDAVMEELKIARDDRQAHAEELRLLRDLVGGKGKR